MRSLPRPKSSMNPILSACEVGMEACEEHHFQGLQLRHLVKSSEEVKVLKFDRESEDGGLTECWLTAICSGSPHFVSHMVKVYRRAAQLFYGSETGDPRMPGSTASRP